MNPRSHEISKRLLWCLAAIGLGMLLLGFWVWEARADLGEAPAANNGGDISEIRFNSPNQNRKASQDARPSLSGPFDDLE